MPDNTPYSHIDHSHCWTEKNPPCGQKIEHLKCCLCEKLNPKALPDNTRKTFKLRQNPDTGRFEPVTPTMPDNTPCEGCEEEAHEGKNTVYEHTCTPPQEEKTYTAKCPQCNTVFTFASDLDLEGSQGFCPDCKVSGNTRPVLSKYTPTPPNKQPEAWRDLIREAHTFLPLDLEGREEFLTHLEQFLISQRASDVRRLEKLKKPEWSGGVKKNITNLKFNEGIDQAIALLSRQ